MSMMLESFMARRNLRVRVLVHETQDEIPFLLGDFRDTET